MEIKCDICGQYYPVEKNNCPYCADKQKNTAPKTNHEAAPNKSTNNELKECRHCAMMIPKKAQVCPHCQKRQGMSSSAYGVIIVILFTICIFYMGYESEMKSTSIDPNFVTDEQIYREFEICMNSAKKEINDNKLEGRRIAASCVGRLKKYGPERGKKAFDLYFDLK